MEKLRREPQGPLTFDGSLADTAIIPSEGELRELKRALLRHEPVDSECFWACVTAYLLGVVHGKRAIKKAHAAGQGKREPKSKLQKH